MSADYVPFDWRDKIPDGSIINCEVSVCQWIDPQDGSLRWQVFYDGELPLSSVLGLLELAKIELINRTPNVLPPGADDD